MNTSLVPTKRRREVPERIVLNIGGIKFVTVRNTLIEPFPLSTLARMFAADNAQLLEPEEDGSYFFDRSPRAFEYILECYRHARLPGDEVPGILKEDWLDDLDFWGLPTNHLQDKEEPLTLGTVLDGQEQLRKELCVLIRTEMLEFFRDNVQAPNNRGEFLICIPYRGEYLARVVPHPNLLAEKATLYTDADWSNLFNTKGKYAPIWASLGITYRKVKSTIYDTEKYYPSKLWIQRRVKQTGVASNASFCYNIKFAE